MWTVIYIASSLQKAEMMQERLTEEGFLVKLRQLNGSKQYELLVPEGEVKDVESVLVNLL
jgi:hypothetical protein